MTSGQFRQIPISTITIAPDRQRSDLGDITSLAQSLSSDGQINPILVTPEHVLVAGERRLTAARQLGWDSIAAQLTTDLPPAQLHKLELEENVRRKDLEWKERVYAIVEYHEICTATDPAHDITASAAALNITDKYITQNIAVAEALRASHPLVSAADNFSAARGIVMRIAERAAAADLHELDSVITGKPASSSPSVSAPEPNTPAPVRVDPDDTEPKLVNMDFRDWLSEPTLAGFNFIHCDFPYGINHNEHGGSAADKFGGYEDTPELYRELLHLFCANIHWLAAESAHIFFWFSMDYYDETLSSLRSAELTVNPFPCVWFKSDNSGILPDPRRGPRRNYETAFIATRGDRPIIQAVSNVAAVPNKKSIHTSEKPIAMLKHFFRMFVDEHSTVFDPTAGSANALKAAEIAGASSVFGLERDPEFYNLALENWNNVS